MPAVVASGNSSSSTADPTEYAAPEKYTATEAALIESDPLYPIVVLIDELRHDKLELRKNAVSHISTIAKALDVERTREELVPFLSSEVIVDDDDEILTLLAEELGKFVPYVGGNQYAYCLIVPLEELANTEEAVVRTTATASLKQIAEEMQPDQVVRHFCPLVHRLSRYYTFLSCADTKPCRRNWVYKSIIIDGQHILSLCSRPT